MFNLRYHIASLVAVFLALAVGLLLGTVIVERGVLDSQKSSLVNGLKTEFESIRKENVQLRGDLQREQSFAGAVVTPLTAGKLTSETVVVIANAGRTDGLQNALDALKAAGARTAVIAFAHRGLALDDPSVVEAVKPALGELGKGEGLGDRTAKVLAAEWRKVGPRPLTQALLSSGQITIDGFGPEAIADGAVLLESWDGKPDKVGLSIASALRDAGAHVVAAQALKRETGVAAAGANAGLDAVDHLGTPEGGVSLVWLLSGASTGYYGIGNGAESTFPKLR